MTYFGALYIIATPLGNLQDMSLRAIKTLQTVNLIAAEDTRHSLPLLQHFSIKTPVISLHEHNENERINSLLDRLQQGESIAVICDAGTPLISDPGYGLVREARRLNIAVVPVPGPCAAIAALSASGLPTDRFVFEGFLPKKLNLRKERLARLKEEASTMIFYEAPHRILAFIQELRSVFGDTRLGVIARELTKVYETIHQGTLAELDQWIRSDPNQERGEIVVLVEGKRLEKRNLETEQQEYILKVLLETLPLKQAVSIAATITGAKKNLIYSLALKIKSDL